MSQKERNIIAYIVACVNEFARSADLSVQQAFHYLNDYGGMTFLTEYYDIEHTLSFDDVVDDLKIITQKSGGSIA